MNSSAKSTAKHFFQDKLAHAPHLPRSSKSTDKHPKPATSDPDYERKHEEEKHFICQFDKDNSKEPLSPSDIARDPSEKLVGHSSKYLKKADFKLIKTIGTGMSLLQLHVSTMLNLDCVRNLCARMACQAGSAAARRRE